MDLSSIKGSFCWLIVAHCFNMDGRAASQTITDRLPHLMRHGVVPVVISAPTGQRDRRLVQYRIFSPAPSGLLFEGRQLIERCVARHVLQQLFKGLLTILLLPAYLVEKLMMDLDSQWSWFASAAALGLIAVRRHRPRLIYSSAGPPSSHIAAWLISRLTRVPWLAEVHDPLVYGNRRPHHLRDLFLALVEAVIFRYAGAIVFFTEQARQDACQRHRPRQKVVVLRPGASPPEIRQTVYHPGDKIHFGHFGSLDRQRHLGSFIQALHAVLSGHPEWRNRIRLDVYGTRLDSDSRQALERWPLGSTLVEHGRIEHDTASGKSGRQQVLEAMRQTDVLLLLHGEGEPARYYVPSKLYEYLLMRRPILCCAVPDSELAWLLGSTGHTIVDPHDSRALEKALADLVSRWAGDGLPDLPAATAFHIENTVQYLLDLADRIAPGAGGRR